MEENKELQELVDNKLEQVSGGTTKITDKEDIDKLFRKICCYCGGYLKLENRRHGHNARQYYVCESCNKKYILYCGVYNKHRGWRGDF